MTPTIWQPLSFPGELRRTVAAVTTAWCVLVTAAVTPHLFAAEPSAKPQYVGSLSCSSVACHGRTEPRSAAGGFARNEFVTWMHTDPHARANRTIWSAKFQQILDRLNGVHGESWDRSLYNQCARCHDPQSATEDLVNRGDSLTPNFVPSAAIQVRGIGCESCHGPAGTWLDKHYQRDTRREQLLGLGMKDTKDLLVRSQACASCHVGSATNDMNHDMIAAGHPALQFEIVSYHDRLPKHWSPVADQMRIPEFHAQLWAAGQLATADAALDLLGGRAARAAQPARPWPEFAEYSCLGCHQRLRTADENRSLRLANNSDIPAGLPVWNPWIEASPLLRREAVLGQESGSPLFNRLRQPMARQRKTSLQEIVSLTKLARGEVQSHFSLLESPPPKAPNKPEGRRVAFSNRDLTAAIRQAAPRAENWEAVCQLFLGLQAAQQGCRDKLHELEFTAHKQLPEMAEELVQRQSELEAIRQALAFGKETDVPRAMLRPRTMPESNAPDSRPPLKLSEIRLLVVRIADEIDRQYLRLETLKQGHL